MGQTQFDQVVFSGGGIRCFWHGGFLSRVGDYDDLRPERVSGVSGGALSRGGVDRRPENDLYALMCEAFEHNDRNFDRRSSNYNPHQEIYRAVVETTLDPDAIARIANGPVFQIVLGLPPQNLPPGLSAMWAGLAYQAEQRIRSTPHLDWTRALGMESLCVDARVAAREGTLIDLIARRPPSRQCSTCPRGTASACSTAA